MRSLRLPQAPTAYDPRVENQFRSKVEEILSVLFRSTAKLADPSKSVNNYRLTTEDATTQTYSGVCGESVKKVWVYELLVAAPVTGDPWQNMGAPTAVLTPDASNIVTHTVNKPLAGQVRLVMIVPRLENLAPGFVIKRVLDPTTATMAGTVKAVVTNALADLEVTIQGAAADFPITFNVYEDAPYGTPILTTSVNVTSTLTKNSAGCAALGGRTLPQREVRRWYVELVNRAGVTKMYGPTSADRDSLPDGSVTTKDGIAAAQLQCEYDDDTTQIRITTPAGKTKTYSGLTGGGTKTYTLGDALDDAATEAALAADEVRATYLVEYTGGGTVLVFFRGSLFGPITPPSVDVTVTPASDKYTFAYTSSGTVKDRIDAAAFANAPASPFDVTRNAAGGADKTIQLYSVAANGVESALRTFTIPAQLGRARVKVTAGAASTNVNDNSSTALPYASEVEDIGGWHDNVTNNSRLTAPAEVVGKAVSLVAQLTWDTNASGQRVVTIRKNGSTELCSERVQAAAAGRIDQNLVVVDVPSTNDYYEVVVVQNCGGTLNAFAGGSYFFQATCLS